jgi:hypothetical protein
MAATGENTVRPSSLRLVPGVLTAKEDDDLGLPTNHRHCGDRKRHFQMLHVRLSTLGTHQIVPANTLTEDQKQKHLLPLGNRDAVRHQPPARPLGRIRRRRRFPGELALFSGSGRGGALSGRMSRFRKKLTQELVPFRARFGGGM